MTDKDPKDMTASELLRNTASSIETHQRSLEYLNMADSINLLREMFCVVENETSYSIDLANTLVAIADKIDAELSEARKDAIRESKKPMWWFRNAIKCGYDWPEPRDGEKFRDYLHRCFLPRPRFEDGEPVQISDMEEIGALATYRVYMDGSWEFEPDKYEDETSPKLWDVQFGAKSERVKRPAPEALGADGLPIVVGETVWGILSGIEGTVSSMNDDSTAYVKWDDGRWSPCIDCCNLTHTPPDTQERIDEDKGKKGNEYWRCVGFLCGDCPAEIDGKRPSDRYGVLNCWIAQGMDIARRQADLDARKGGE
ncbi:hypothetical protein [Adlercreutzia sp. CNCM I-6216]